MVDNGLSADQATLEQVVMYLTRKYGTAQIERAPGQAAVTAVESVETRAGAPPPDDKDRRRRRGQ
jgi:hypothetical protein